MHTTAAPEQRHKRALIRGDIHEPEYQSDVNKKRRREGEAELAPSPGQNCKARSAKSTSRRTARVSQPKQ